MEWPQKNYSEDYSFIIQAWLLLQNKFKNMLLGNLWNVLHSISKHWCISKHISKHTAFLNTQCLVLSQKEFPEQVGNGMKNLEPI